MKPSETIIVNRKIIDQLEELKADNKRLKEQVEKAKKALCECHRMALSEETDISRIVDIVHPVIVKLNNGV